MKLPLLALFVTLSLSASLHAGCSRTEPSAGAPSEPDIKVGNASNPGQVMELANLAVPGKTTLIEFTSRRCPACLEMERVMDFLARNKEGLAIRQVDIDRPDSQGIDFDSPISAQWEVESVPSFLIYDENGKVTYRGNQAKDQVRDWYNQAQLAHSAEQNPDLSAPYDNTGSSH